MDVLQVIVAALIAALTSLITLWAKRKLENAQAEREHATAADTLTDSALSLLAPYKDENMTLRDQVAKLRLIQTEMQQEIDELKKQIRKLTQQFDDVVAGAHRLVHQVQSHGSDPVYVPPERRKEEGNAEEG